MQQYSATRGQILKLLEAEGDTSQESIKRVSEATGVPEADVYGTARFYDLIVLNPYFKTANIAA